ncbi:MAG: CidA/LrgA family protein [Roseburia sp.]|nr:CidA/LrgA family protein [Roseburia sp.]
MKWIRQLAVILSISFLAELMEYLIPLPVTASIYGLILMLTGLLTGVIPLEKVENAADFLVELLPVLFIPPTVGIMASVEEMQQMLIPLFVISVVSTLLVMVVTGRTAQAILRRKEEGRGTRRQEPDDELLETTEREEKAAPGGEHFTGRGRP